MKRSPDTGDVLQADNVCSGVHQFKLELGRSCRKRTMELCEHGSGAKVNHLRAVSDRRAFLVREAGKNFRAVGGLAVKILIH